MDHRECPPAIARQARLPLAVLATLSAATVTVLSLRYAGTEGPGRVDAQLGRFLTERLSSQRGSLRWVVTLLGPPTVAVLAALTALIAWRLRRVRLAVVALVGPVLTGIVTSVLQPLVGRTLDGGAALPSGHTAGVTAAAAVAALLAAQTSGRTHRWVGPAAAIAVPAAGGWMAVALVVNGLHMPTDTVAGFCTAIGVVIGVALSVDGLASVPGHRTTRRRS